MAEIKDISPGLLKKIKEDFNAAVTRNKKISASYAKIEAGTATYAEANSFAIEVGEMLAQAFQRNISSAVLPDGKMYYNIAKSVVEPMMINNYDLIADFTEKVQKSLNKAANIGIKAIRPELNQDRIDGIINRLTATDVYENVRWILEEPVVRFSQSVVDDAIESNANFHSASGLKPKIIRKTAGNCCDWCREIAGAYSYPNVPKDVYRRHSNCRCVVEYYPGDGKKQNVHTKKWQSQTERDKIEQRKHIGLISNDNQIQNYIREKIIPNQRIDNIVGRQEIHRQGTKMYQQRQHSLQSKGQYGPSYITISDDDVLRLVNKYSGKGEIKYDRNGKWNNQETIVTNDEIIGVVFNNQNGKHVQTSVFKIHYSENGVHIVPDYPSKKR